MKRRPRTPGKRKGVWPLPSVGERRVPAHGPPGSFWEDRKDRRHCGVDIRATFGSEVVSIDDGLVSEVGTFTEADVVPYWNETFYVIVEEDGGQFVKFAELGEVEVRAGDRIRSGQKLGRVGSVLDPEKIDDGSPSYIRRLKDEGQISMLHLEIYRSRPEPSDQYRGGNWFGTGKPKGLIDPTSRLDALSIQQDEAE